MSPFIFLEVPTKSPFLDWTSHQLVSSTAWTFSAHICTPFCGLDVFLYALRAVDSWDRCLGTPKPLNCLGTLPVTSILRESLSQKDTSFFYVRE